MPFLSSRGPIRSRLDATGAADGCKEDSSHGIPNRRRHRPENRPSPTLYTVYSMLSTASLRAALHRQPENLVGNPLENRFAAATLFPVVDFEPFSTVTWSRDIAPSFRIGAELLRLRDDSAQAAQRCCCSIQRLKREIASQPGQFDIKLLVLRGKESLGTLITHRPAGARPSRDRGAKDEHYVLSSTIPPYP